MSGSVQHLYLFHFQFTFESLQSGGRGGREREYVPRTISYNNYKVYSDM